MSTTLRNKPSRGGGASDDYLALVRRFPLRPIRSEVEHEKAVAVMTTLALKGEGGLRPGERDYLDALTVFVTRFDGEHFPIRARRTPLERLKYLMEANGMKPVDLGALVGGRGQASLILSGKRELSKANIRTLAARFKVSPALFL